MLRSSPFNKKRDVEYPILSEGVIGLSKEGKIIFANPAASLYLKHPLESLIGKVVNEEVSKDEPFFAVLQQGIEQIQASQRVGVEIRFVLSSRHEVTVSAFFNERLHIEGYMVFLRDFSKNAISKSTRHVAIEDELTKLLNGKAFFHRLEHALAACNRYQIMCAVLVINIDDFKVINETLGQHYGDILLCEVARRIQSVIRKMDVLARKGGDEFILLLPQVSSMQEAGQMAAKINRTFMPAFTLNGHNSYITGSIGVAFCPNDSEKPQGLVQCAVLAMEKVKKSGKNHFQYYQQGSITENPETRKLSKDLLATIQNDQLDVYFHPQVTAKDSIIYGLEALARWHHPELGLVPPPLFLPIAEKMDFIHQLDFGVLDKACRHHQEWLKNKMDHFGISVNVSLKTILRPEFLKLVKECAEKHDISPAQIQFEVAETIIAHHHREILPILQELRHWGAKIALDDFETGYSCLSMLEDFPLDMIKIGRSFVQTLGFPNHKRQKAILGAIIAVAKRQHIAVLAQGVETPDQAAYLASAGCDYLQGFLFAKPMSYQDMTEFMQKLK